MRSRRLGLRALGVCLALAGLMAVGVASAQAGGSWLVEGKAVTNALNAELTGSFENNHSVLLGVIGTKPIHLLCTGVTVTEGGLKENGGVEGKVQFSACQVSTLTVGKVERLAACDPPGGVLTFNLSKGLLSLHLLLVKEIIEGKEVTLDVIDTIIVLEPSAGTLLTSFAGGEECAFGEKITIGGKLAFIDAEVGVSKVTHLIKEFAPLTQLFLNGNVSNKMTLDGSVEVKLKGAHAGLKWSGDPA